MKSNKTKEFRDPLHGYVAVPASMCDAFIDTPIFQRLKHIEQTSMRPLYPSAHHNRFAHSLGVFHLAEQAFRYLKQNTSKSVLAGVKLEGYEQAFLIAALMHDCAHSPFSHVFEAHYGRGERHKEFLFSFVDAAFKKDYNGRCSQFGGVAQHEVFSAAVFLKHFQTGLRELAPDCDPILIARMITGCTHLSAPRIQDQVENCLIKLINGPAIDVDKLDYILRDTWSSGVNNVSIDVQRLLAALEIVKGPRGPLVVAFRKAALSVIQNVIDGRNFLFRWIYAHHTVLYYGHILQKAVERLDEVLSPPGTFLERVFSKEAFEEPEDTAPGEERIAVYLPCDYDIFALLKSHRSDIPEVDELLGRRPSLLPLWKTQAEFETIFSGNSDPKKRSYIRDNLSEILAPPLPKSCDVLDILVKPKVIETEEDDIYVTLLDQVVPFKELAEKWDKVETDKRNVSFFYAFVPREHCDKIRACVEKLQNYRVSS